MSSFALKPSILRTRCIVRLARQISGEMVGAMSGSGMSMRSHASKTAAAQLGLHLHRAAALQANAPALLRPPPQYTVVVCRSWEKPAAQEEETCGDSTPGRAHFPAVS